MQVALIPQKRAQRVTAPGREWFSLGERRGARNEHGCCCGSWTAAPHFLEWLLFVERRRRFCGGLCLRLLVLLPAPRGALHQVVEEHDADEGEYEKQLDGNALHAYGLRGAAGSSPLAIAPRMSVSACTFFMR